MAPLKILVTGVAPSLTAFITKLGQLQQKHSFDLVLSLDLFTSATDDEVTQLLEGKLKVPVQVYVADNGLPSRIRAKVDKGEEVTTNLSVLGKTALLTLASGLRIATFGGSSLTPSPSDASFTTSSLSDFTSLLTPAAFSTNSLLPPKPIPSPDILLTHLLPSSLPLLSSKPLTSASANSDELNEVAQKARAKYHFIGGVGAFWEREPFQWGATPADGICRAIALGEMGNKSKERWFYAFSITPSAAPTAVAGATANPFLSSASGPRGMKRPAGSLDGADGDLNEFGVPNYIFGGGGGGRDNKKGRGGPPDHYTCNICQQKGHWIQDCPEKAERDAQREAERAANPGMRGGPRAKPISPDECWFCLSNPRVTKHLIASIGEEVYLTLPKGQLCATGAEGAEVEGKVPGGGHVLIIPIAHYPTLLSIPADSSEPILAEVASYKEALQKLYNKHGCELVAFEVGRLGGKGGHAHVQVCPVPSTLTSEAIESHFRTSATSAGLTFSEEEDANTRLTASAAAAEGQHENYFRVDLPGGKVLVCTWKMGERFDLGFGRTTLATLLNTPERADWRACSQSDQEEKRDTQAFKKAFKEFDPAE